MIPDLENKIYGQNKKILDPEKSLLKNNKYSKEEHKI